MTIPSADKLQVGDAVTELTPPDGYIPRAGTTRPALRPRHGRVVGMAVKRNARGRRMTYVEVLWDGRRSPSTHAACRLIRMTPAG
ncbi:MAG: hypothetical protein ACO4B5_11470 [Steroidobacteraceae bacterium]